MGFVLLGVLTGIFSGLVGLGGGAIVIPGLMYFFGQSQHLAQGTSLAMMLPPIGILAVWTYAKHGHVDFKIAGLLVIGFLIGSVFGAKIAVLLSASLIKKTLGVSLVCIGLKMIFY